ncbi:MAG: GAF domain-containing protein, partial [Anaerolineales bacterium]
GLALRAAWGLRPEEAWEGLRLAVGEGIPGAVLRHSRLERWDDVRQCAYHVGQRPFEWVRSELAVPILVAGQAVGVLEALSPHDSEFWELDEEHLMLMADSIGIALARSQHVRQEAERLRDTLWHAVSRLSDCATIEEMFDEVAHEARDHLGAGLVVLYQLAPGTGYPLAPPLFKGDFHDPDTLRLPQVPEDSVLFDLLERWEPYYSTDAQADLLLKRGTLPSSGAAGDGSADAGLTVPYGTRNRFIFREAVRSVVFLPLGSRSERVGALFLHYRVQRSFSPLDKLTFEAFASLVAEQIIRERAQWRKYEAFGGVLFGVHGPLTLSADSIRRLTGSALEVLRTDPATAEAALEQAQKVARKLEMAAMLTRLSQRDQLDGTGMREALRRAATKVVQLVEPREAYRVHTDIPDEADDLPIEVLDALYCLAMEAVANAAFHGHARRIDIGVALERARIRLTVSDNGQGFDPASARHGPNGIFEGLELVRQQFAAQGCIESQPGGGTRIEVSFPCLADILEVTSDELEVRQ